MAGPTCTLRGPGQWKVTVRGKEGGVSGPLGGPGLLAQPADSLGEGSTVYYRQAGQALAHSENALSP